MGFPILTIFHAFFEGRKMGEEFNFGTSLLWIPRSAGGTVDVPLKMRGGMVPEPSFHLHPVFAADFWPCLPWFFLYRMMFSIRKFGAKGHRTFLSTKIYPGTQKVFTNGSSCHSHITQQLWSVSFASRFFSRQKPSRLALSMTICVSWSWSETLESWGAHVNHISHGECLFVAWGNQWWWFVLIKGLYMIMLILYTAVRHFLQASWTSPPGGNPYWATGICHGMGCRFFSPKYRGNSHNFLESHIHAYVPLEVGRVMQIELQHATMCFLLLKPWRVAQGLREVSAFPVWTTSWLLEAGTIAVHNHRQDIEMKPNRLDENGFVSVRFNFRLDGVRVLNRETVQMMLGSSIRRRIPGVVWARIAIEGSFINASFPPKGGAIAIESHLHMYCMYYCRWWFQTFFIFTMENDPIWRAYCSNGLVQPPTSIYDYIIIVFAQML